MSQKKVLSVESVRGWACFMVLLSHLSLIFFPYAHAFIGEADPIIHPYQSFLHESPFGFFYSGISAVFIFFVLSGYILTKVALRKESSYMHIISMALKRYPRLMIPTLASCLIAYALFYFFDIESKELSDWINNYSNHDHFSLIGSIYSGLIDVFFGSGYSVYNPVLWTMQIELIGSLIVYLLCISKNNIFLIFSIILCTCIATWANIVTLELGLGLLSFYGGYFYSLYGKMIKTYVALTLAFIGLYLAGAHNTSVSYSLLHHVLGDQTYMICNFISGFFIVYAIIFSDTISEFFSGKFSVFMGKVSFSVYLIHIPVLSVFGVAFFNTIFGLIGQYNVSALIASVMSILIIYFLSLLFYRMIDSKGIIISNYFSSFIILLIKKYYRLLRNIKDRNQIRE